MRKSFPPASPPPLPLAAKRLPITARITRDMELAQQAIQKAAGTVVEVVDLLHSRHVPPTQKATPITPPPPQEPGPLQGPPAKTTTGTSTPPSTATRTTGQEPPLLVLDVAATPPPQPPVAAAGSHAKVLQQTTKMTAVKPWQIVSFAQTKAKSRPPPAKRACVEVINLI